MASRCAYKEGIDLAMGITIKCGLFSFQREILAMGEWKVKHVHKPDLKAMSDGRRELIA